MTNPEPPRCTYEEAADAVEARYGANWSWDDPEWWNDMVDIVMQRGIGWLEDDRG